MEFSPSELFITRIRGKRSRLDSGYNGAFIHHLTSGIIVESTSERSYHANLSKCYKLLESQLDSTVESLAFVRVPEVKHIRPSVLEQLDQPKYYFPGIDVSVLNQSLVLKSGDQTIMMDYDQLDSFVDIAKQLLENSEAY